VHHPQGVDLKKTFKRLFEEPKGFLESFSPRMLVDTAGEDEDVLKRRTEYVWSSELADQKYFIHFHGKFE
jgi:hypothetical protein